MPDTWFEAPPPPAPAREILTISQLNLAARTLLERGLGSVWLEGEISNLARPASGHWYFSLKDSGAQVRCAMFRAKCMLVRFPVRDGMHIVARGRVSLYEARGEFQVVIEHLEEAGAGALRRRFDELKQRLQVEGLFDSVHKKPRPALPRRIGVITSPSGAALRDILHVLRRRFPAIPVLIYPVSVQGEAAPREIAHALRLAGQRAECDVLIVARGGGSLEDLLAFNDETVARAMFACPIPIISGVGHETDVTIADFVADERAPTPSGAAERAVPDRAEFLRALGVVHRHVVNAMRRRLHSLRQVLLQSERGLERSHPGARLRQHAQRLDELDLRLQRSLRARLERARVRLVGARALLARSSPARRVAQANARLEVSQRALVGTMRRRLQDAHARWDRSLRTLHAVSPLATLERGYAIALDDTGAVLTDAVQASVGGTVTTRLARGSLRTTVVEIVPGAANPTRDP